MFLELLLRKECKSMKKFILFFFLFVLSITANCYAGTYDAVLSDAGYQDIHNNYIDKPQLKSILEIIFKKELNYDVNRVGHSNGTDFFSMVEDELGYDSRMVEKKESYYRRALTFASLYELLDYYYPYISEIHGLENVSGKLSFSSSGYLLTYGEGEVLEMDEFKYFKAAESLYDVWVILKNGKIIDVCPVDRDIPLSRFTGKKEVAGRLFLQYDKGIIIEINEELFEYQTTSSFKILNSDYSNEVVLILGDYKKNKEMASIAVGRMK